MERQDKAAATEHPPSNDSRLAMDASPWSKDIEDIRGQLKSRETNPVRAIATFVDELFIQSRGGKAVSKEAITGLVFSLLRPRFIIAAGSLISGALLITQTVILNNQTKLLSSQADAADLERMVLLSGQADHILSTMGNISEIFEFIVGAQEAECDDNCKKQAAGPALKAAIAKIGPPVRLSEASPMLLASERERERQKPLSSAEAAAFNAALRMKAIDKRLGKVENESFHALFNREFFRKTLRPATSLCAINPNHTAETEESFVHLSNAISLMVDGEVAGYLNWLNLEFGTYPGFLRLTDAEKISLADAYTVGDFLADAERFRRRLEARLDHFSTMCRKQRTKYLSFIERINDRMGAEIK